MFQNYVTSLFQWSEAELLDFGYYLLQIREILLTLYAKILQSFGIENLTISKAVLVSIFGEILVHRDCYQWWIQNFPWGAPTPNVGVQTYYFGRKLHENERISTPGACLWPPLDPPLVTSTQRTI